MDSSEDQDYFCVFTFTSESISTVNNVCNMFITKTQMKKI